METRWSRGHSQDSGKLFVCQHFPHIFSTGKLFPYITTFLAKLSLKLLETVLSVKKFGCIRDGFYLYINGDQRRR